MADAVKTVHSGKTRTESDSMGKMDVPADRYYGAQTARAGESGSSRSSSEFQLYWT